MTALNKVKDNNQLTSGNLLHDEPGRREEPSGRIKEGVATPFHYQPDLVGAVHHREHARLGADPRDGGWGKDLLGGRGRDGGDDVFLVGASVSVDLYPPHGAAVVAAPLDQIPLPGDTEDSEGVLFCELDGSDRAHVALPVASQVREEVLAVARGVDEVVGREDCSYFCD